MPLPAPSFLAPVPISATPAAPCRHGHRSSYNRGTIRCSLSHPKSLLCRPRVSAPMASPNPPLSESDLHFRRYAPSDGPAAVSLYATGMSHHLKRASHPMTQRMFARAVELAPKFVDNAAIDAEAAGGFFLAFAPSGELAGMVAVRVTKEDREQGVAEVMVYVSENFRRRGVGTTIVRFACRFARDSCDARTVYLMTHQSMESSVAF